MTRRHLWRGALALVALVVAGLAVRSLVRAWREAAAQPVEWHVSPGWIALAAAVAVATYAILIEGWRLVLRGYGEAAPRGPAFRVWILSNFGKYLGSFGIVAGMAVLAQGAGIGPAAAVTAAIVMQVLSLATGVALAGLLAGRELQGLGPVFTWGAAAVGVAAVAASVVLASPRAMARLQRLLPDRAPVLRAATPGGIVVAFVANLVAWAGYGAAMVCLSRGLFAGAAPAWPDAINAYTVSYLFGLLLLFVPAGLGAREAIFTALLAPAIGVKVAAALAVASRILLTLIEIALAAAFAFRRRPTDAVSSTARDR